MTKRVQASTSRKSLAGLRRACETGAMLNIASILIGLVALLLAIPAFIPFPGWANWLVIPIAIVGLALGAMSDRNGRRTLNIDVIVFCKNGKASCRVRASQVL